jgi:hypothetical protein
MPNKRHGVFSFGFVTSETNVIFYPGQDSMTAHRVDNAVGMSEVDRATATLGSAIRHSAIAW